MLIEDLTMDNGELNFAVYSRMTTAIINTTRRAGGCGQQDLIGQGFSSDEIECHWQISKTLAHIELNWPSGSTPLPLK